jgi:hypothetical protein
MPVIPSYHLIESKYEEIGFIGRFFFGGLELASIKESRASPSSRDASYFEIQRYTSIEIQDTRKRDRFEIGPHNVSIWRTVSFYSAFPIDSTLLYA